MKQAKIYKSGNFLAETDKLGMPEEDLNKWLAKHIAKNTFGLPERPELMLDEATGEMIPTGNTLPAEYEIVIEDITAQVEQEKINAEALVYLASTDWLIIRELDAGVPCPVDIKVKRQQARDRIVK